MAEPFAEFLGRSFLSLPHFAAVDHHIVRVALSANRRFEFPETPSVFHPRAQRTAFRRHDVRQQSRLFSRLNPRLTHSRFSQVSALFTDYLPADIETIILSQDGRLYFSSAFA
jgi:hypothetical protein